MRLKLYQRQAEAFPVWQMSAGGSETDRERINYELRGKTLKVYLFLLRKGSGAGVREIQRELGFSSPSIAFHHIEKLIRLQVVEQDKYGNYILARKVDPGVLQAFVNVGRFTFPRVAFYATFFTTIAVAYIVRSYSNLDAYAVIASVGGAAAFWYEVWRAWRRKPF